MIMVKSQAEENLLLELVAEFASKVVMPRLSAPTETFKKYAANGVYGIVGVDTDEKTLESLFQIELPPSYLGYIEYEVQKLRDFVASKQEEILGKNILL